MEYKIFSYNPKHGIITPRGPKPTVFAFSKCKNVHHGGDKCAYSKGIEYWGEGWYSFIFVYTFFLNHDYLGFEFFLNI